MHMHMHMHAHAHAHAHAPKRVHVHVHVHVMFMPCVHVHAPEHIRPWGEDARRYTYYGRWCYTYYGRCANGRARLMRQRAKRARATSPASTLKQP